MAKERTGTHGGARPGAGSKGDEAHAKCRVRNHAVLLEVFSEDDVMRNVAILWRRFLDPNEEVDQKVRAKMLEIHAAYTMGKPTKFIELKQDTARHIRAADEAKAAMIAQAAEEANARQVDESA